MFAEVNSGLSLFASSSDTKLVIPIESTDCKSSTSTPEFVIATASKAVDLTVITFMLSLDLTVAMQLPA